MEFDLLHNLATGFSAAATLKNLGFAFLGCLLGTLIGVLPGIGPIPTIAMLLPITFGLDPLSSLVMMRSLYRAGSPNRSGSDMSRIGSDSSEPICQSATPVM